MIVDYFGLKRDARQSAGNIKLVISTPLGPFVALKGELGCDQLSYADPRARMEPLIEGFFLDSTSLISLLFTNSRR
jgi:hypothetical protein